MLSETIATCIIPTRGDSKTLHSLLEELERQRRNYSKLYQVLVVGDNITPTATSELTKCVAYCGARGVSSVRNYGAKLADTPWLIFLDDDVVPHSSWVSVLSKFLREPNCDIAGGRLDIFPPEHRNLLPEKYCYLLGEKSSLNSRLRKFEYVAGAHLLIRKSVYEELGGFCKQWGHKGDKMSLNEDVLLQALYRKRYKRHILYLDELRCNHYVRSEQINSKYLINRLQAQGKADAALDMEYYPNRSFIKSIYYNLFCLLNRPSDSNLSLNSCNWYRRHAYLAHI